MRSDQDVATVIARLNESFAFKTIDMRVEILQSWASDDGSQPLETRLQDTYQATSKGRSFYDQWASRADYGSRKSRYRDGRKCACVDYEPKDLNRQRSISIARSFWYEAKYGFLEGPRPYDFISHVGLKPLWEALPSSAPLGPARCIERDCVRYHFKGVGPAVKTQSLVYHLDLVSGVPLKVEAFDGPEQILEKSPNWVWEAQTLDQVGKNRYFPLKSTYTTYNAKKQADGSLTSVPGMSQKITVTKLDFDVPLSNTLFWPEYQSGVEIFDSLAPRKSQEGETRSVPPAGEPIRVQDSSQVGLLMPGLVLGLSLLVLGVAGVLWKRAR